MTHVNNGGILMEIGEGNQHFDVIYILQISMRNVWNLYSTNIRSTTIIQIQIWIKS